jgi:hypothetical protein
LAHHHAQCTCGKTFLTAEELSYHQTTQKTLDEIERIGGPHFRRFIHELATDQHTAGFDTFAKSDDLDYSPENATRIAQNALKYVIDHYDEHQQQLQRIQTKKEEQGLAQRVRQKLPLASYLTSG